MEDLPKTSERVKLPIETKTDSYLQDHCLEGKAVLPAVEAMQMLASSTLAFLPNAEVTLISNARFDKFLRTGAAAGSLEAYNEIEICEDDRINSKLITKSRSPKAFITRIVEHITVQFGGEKYDTFPFPIEFVSALEGVCFDIPAGSLYRDLVPFGPAYQNVILLIKGLFILRQNSLNLFSALGSLRTQPN